MNTYLTLTTARTTTMATVPFGQHRGNQALQHCLLSGARLVDESMTKEEGGIYKYVQCSVDMPRSGFIHISLFSRHASRVRLLPIQAKPLRSTLFLTWLLSLPLPLPLSYDDQEEEEEEEEGGGGRR